MSSKPPGARPESDDGTLDAEAVERLRELDPGGRTRLFERVLRAFETSVLRLLPQLRDARQRGDSAAIGSIAHTLKSSSASIGALKLARLCTEAETMIRNNSTQGVDSHALAIEAELEVVLKALQPLLRTTP